MLSELLIWPFSCVLVFMAKTFGSKQGNPILLSFALGNILGCGLILFKLLDHRSVFVLAWLTGTLLTFFMYRSDEVSKKMDFVRVIMSGLMFSALILALVMI